MKSLIALEIYRILFTTLCCQMTVIIVDNYKYMYWNEKKM